MKFKWIILEDKDLVRKRCVFCNKILDGYAKKYCTKSCRSKKMYQDNKEEFIAWTKQFKKDNPEKVKQMQKKAHEKMKKSGRINELMKLAYLRNKDKWKCRGQTYDIMKNQKKVCSTCGSLEDIQIHHEIYPKTKQDIIEGIVNGRIMFLCRKCHLSVTNK